MLDVSFNSSVIRLLLFVAILVIPQILRAVQKAQTKKTQKPAGTVARPASLPDLLETLRKSAEDTRARRPAEITTAEPQELREMSSVETPRGISFESAIMPSLLLVALLISLGWLAYHYWAR
jgi:hypothetical protein